MHVGVDLVTIQSPMGLSRLDTTARCLRLRTDFIETVQSPLGRLSIPRSPTQ